MEPVEEHEGVPLSFPIYFIVPMPEVEACSVSSSAENEDSLLAYDSDKIDVVSLITHTTARVGFNYSGPKPRDCTRSFR